MTTLAPSPVLIDAFALASERLLRWQKDQFDRNGAQVPTDGVAPDPVINDRFVEFQRAVQTILSPEVLELLGQPVAYITALHPYEPVYSTAALIGDWPEWRRGIWRRWMGTARQRSVSEGMLFRRAYGLEFGEPLVIPESWKDSTEFVSRETRDLDLGYAAVIPLLHQAAYLGLLTIGFDSENLRDSMLHSVHRLAQLIVVPLLQPHSPAISERSLVDGVTRIYRPIMWRVHRTLSTYSANFEEKVRALNSARGTLGQGLTVEGRRKVESELRDIQALMELAAVQLRGEAERGLSLVHGLAPGKPDSPFADDLGYSTTSELKAIVDEVVKVLASDPEGEFDALVRTNWVQFSAPPDFAVPLSYAQAQVVFEELLRNSFRAIGQHFLLLANDPEVLITGPEMVARYVATRGCEPTVRIDCEGPQADASGHLVLRIWDNGVGMPAEILTRALELGFSTKTEGTGTGLNIVRALTALRGGTVRVSSSATREGTEPRDIYSLVELRF